MRLGSHLLPIRTLATVIQQTGVFPTTTRREDPKAVPKSPLKIIIFLSIEKLRIERGVVVGLICSGVLATRCMRRDWDSNPGTPYRATILAGLPNQPSSGTSPLFNHKVQLLGITQLIGPRKFLPQLLQPTVTPIESSPREVTALQTREECSNQH